MTSSHLAHAGEGAVGGLLGMIFLRGATRVAAAKLPEPWHPTRAGRSPGEYVVGRAELAMRRPLPLKWHGRATAASGFVYGGAWGAALGVLAPVLGVRSVSGVALAGAALGATVWAVGYVGWMPATGLVPPIHRQGATHVTTSFGAHVGFGLVTALVMHALDRALGPKRPTLARRLLAAIR